MELKMETELDLLKSELYGDPSNSIADIKFYPGQANSSPEEVARETRKAIKAFTTGNCEDIPLSIAK
jgi:hypothetical protein